MISHEDLVHKINKTGLTDKESFVYSYLIETGGGYPSKISEVTKLNRSTVYKILTSLAVKGLVTEIEKRKKLFFQPESPEKLLRFAEMKKQRASEDLEYAKKVFPELEALFSLSPGKPVVRFFQDKSGIMSIFEDHIKTTKAYEMVGFANIGGLEDIFPKDFFRKYVATKEKLKITTRGIVQDTTQDRTFNDRMYTTVQAAYKLQLRYVPSKYIPLQGELICYAENKVSIVNKTESGFVGIIIEDKPIHEMVRKIFELAWIGAEKFQK
ncbi:MAG: hypothetical protein HZA80_01950 [Candidatus Taylorbacteria bacterium]|nr:hypothetical protein [Candidatus Taylorbacteria bacterium]